MRHLNLIALSVLLTAVSADAQQPSTTETNELNNVTIEREPVQVIPSDDLQIPLVLEPHRQVELVAHADGVVAVMNAKVGEKLAKQAEAARLDDREYQLELKQARAELKLAEIQEEGAIAGTKRQMSALVEAREAAVSLAELRRSRAIVRAPFAGTALRVHVREGEWVRAGQPLVTLGDVTKLSVELPVIRKSAGDDEQENTIEVGKSYTLQINGESVTGTIESLPPLAEDFGPLRNFIDNLGSAVVTIDNSKSTFLVGQAVHIPLIPRQPVASVPNASLQALPENSGWKVQVVRDDTVRDITVSILARINEERTYTSGLFQAKDELIVKTSQPLTDGTKLRSANTPPPESKKPAPKVYDDF
ncbi:efflux RND transporter periplasmic adaptor subunit [Thalassoroseus pseudoceratinae]|uniref:efflux RND transporter periplasmic adaptor subunit n=1 Tax=Thalassoroseus pseudoceratinae TaxID=2713176 RepID=UPI001421AFC6|nr:HlyD family efflux transporter periplasmic adaptor subunit [Thalassoroseus pseudoceratinae]